MSLRRPVGYAAVLVLLALLLAPAPAAAQSGRTAVFIELHPSTIQAGMHVEIRASCGDSGEPGVVRSRALGPDVELVANDSGELRGTVTVPTGIEPGEYRVDLRCDDGSRARAELIVLEMKRPTRGPEAGGGGASGGGPRATAGPLFVAGVALAALGAGGWLLAHRRRTG